MRPKSLLLIVIALGCGLVASIGISKVIEKKDAIGNVAPQTRSVLVAKVDIPVNEILSSASVVLEDWPIEKIPQDALSSIEDLDRRRARQPLYAGEPILDKKLIDGTQDGLAETIAKGFRVVSVKVSINNAVSGLILPGDRVDVMVFLKKSHEIDRTNTKTILSDVTVFAIDDRISREPEDEESAMSARTVSLLVKPDQAEKLLLAEELGTIRLALRRTDENAVPSTQGADIGSLDNSDKAFQNHTLPPTPLSDSGFPDLLEEKQPTNDPHTEDDTEFKMQVVTPNGITVMEFDQVGGLFRELDSTAGPSGPDNATSPSGDPISPGKTPPNTPGTSRDAPAPGGILPTPADAESPEFDLRL